MSGTYQAVRERIAQVIDGNIGNRITPELAAGLMMAFDSCIAHLLAPPPPPVKPPPESGHE